MVGRRRLDLRLLASEPPNLVGFPRQWSIQTSCWLADRLQLTNDHTDCPPVILTIALMFGSCRIILGVLLCLGQDRGQLVV